VTAEPTRIVGGRGTTLLKPPWWIAALGALAVAVSIVFLNAGSDQPSTHWVGWVLGSVALFSGLAFWKSERMRKLSRRYSPSALVGPVAVVVIVVAVALIVVHAWYLARWLAV